MKIFVSITTLNAYFCHAGLSGIFPQEGFPTSGNDINIALLMTVLVTLVRLTTLWAYAHNTHMSRPQKLRCVRCKPDAAYFKPRGIPLIDLEEVSITMDELEAIRLADYEELYHEDAAKKMKISRQTFGRILNNAHKKVSECLIKGKALRIETREKEDKL